MQVSITWGITTSQAYFPKDNSRYFDGVDMNLVDWLRQYSKDQDESFLRGFLGPYAVLRRRSAEESERPVRGRKVRCMLSKMMLNGANVLLLDEPTNHLDLGVHHSAE